MQEQIDAINNRLDKGEDKFSQVADALSNTKNHLQRQDETMAQIAEKLDGVVDSLIKTTAHLQSQDATMAVMVERVKRTEESTQSIVDMWHGGVKAVQFFCRLAEAWRFFIKSVFIPVIIPLALLFSFLYYRSNGVVPDWIKFLIKLLA